jgi:phytoene dehydrogenase-like protein
MLDGTRSLDEVKDEFEAEFPPQKITLEELQQFLGQLHRSGLIVANVPGQGRELRKRRDEKRRKELDEAAMEKWARVAPNMKKENIIMKVTETPEDIAKRFPNMRRGGIKHGDYNPLQLGYFRPNSLCSTSKTPVPGLYVCGASSYPGGMVTGGSGYVAVNKVAADMGIKKWWKPTREMQRYLDTYKVTA